MSGCTLHAALSSLCSLPLHSNFNGNTKIMKIPCSVALVLVAGSPQGGAGFIPSTAGLRKAGAGTRRGNMRMAGEYSGDVLREVRTHSSRYPIYLHLGIPPLLSTLTLSCLTPATAVVHAPSRRLPCSQQQLSLHSPGVSFIGRYSRMFPIPDCSVVCCCCEEQRCTAGRTN